MKEIPLFFDNGNYRLFGILHDPENEPNGIGFVFCHPFAEEKLWSHRVYVNYARKLTALGYTILRFDYMGHGDSDGNFEDSTIETRISDIKCAINFIEKRVKSLVHIGLLGLRFGATLAAIVAEECNNIDMLVLWEPILKGSLFMKQLLRINISTQGTAYKEIRYNSKALIEKMENGEYISIGGYDIGWDLYDQTSRINLVEKIKKFNKQVLIIKISKQKTDSFGQLDEFKKTYIKCQLKSVVEERFWDEIKTYYWQAENLYKITTDWIIKNEG